MMELTSGVWRTGCGIMLQAYFSFGQILIGVLAMYVKDWRYLYWYSTSPSIALLAYF